MDASELLTDFGTYLGIPSGELDNTRALLVLRLAIDRCTALIDPLPYSATGVVLDVAQRAYTNVTGASAESVGPFSHSLPSIGVSLTSSNRRELRQLSGRGSAFSIDPTPADAGSRLPIWDTNTTWLYGVPGLTDRE